MDGEARSLTSVVCHLSSDSHSSAGRLFSGAGRAVFPVSFPPLSFGYGRARGGAERRETRDACEAHNAVQKIPVITEFIGRERRRGNAGGIDLEGRPGAPVARGGRQEQGRKTRLRPPLELCGPLAGAVARARCPAQTGRRYRGALRSRSSLGAGAWSSSQGP
jgi:hypothetical protein